LGHVLRLPENSPPALALVYALDGCHAKSRRGRHQINSFNAKKILLELKGIQLRLYRRFIFVEIRWILEVVERSRRDYLKSSVSVR